MTNKRFLKAYARYDGNGRLIPGSNILRKNKPMIGNWVEISAYECCNYTTTTTTTFNPNDCYTYTFVSVRGSATLVYTDCYGQTQEASYDTPQEFTFCSNGDISYTGESTSVTYEGLCTTTTTLFPSALCSTLDDAASFVIFGHETITNTGNTIVNGDLGLSPGTSVTGFPPGIITGTRYVNVVAAANALVSAQETYTCLSTLTPTGVADADIGGQEFGPGVYTVDTSLAITNNVTLNGGGNPDAIFVFVIGSTFNPTNDSTITLTGETKPCNVWWMVGSSATLSLGATVVGNIIAQISITFNAGASLTGRAFALTGAVTMSSNIVTGCNCSIDPCTNPPTTTTTTTGVPTTTTTTTGVPTTTTTTTGG